MGLNSSRDTPDHKRFDVTDRAKNFGFFIRDFDIEGFFDRHHELHDVKRVGTQVVNDIGFGLHLRNVNTKLV